VDVLTETAGIKAENVDGGGKSISSGHQLPLVQKRYNAR